MLVVAVVAVVVVFAVVVGGIAVADAVNVLALGGGASLCAFITAIYATRAPEKKKRNPYIGNPLAAGGRGLRGRPPSVLAA